MNKKIIWSIAIIAVGIIGVFIFNKSESEPDKAELISASYSDEVVTVEVTFDVTNNTATFLHSSVGEITLPLAISASGARYANQDETIVLWEHQDNLTITKDGAVVFEGKKVNPNEILNGGFPNEHIEKSIINYLLNQKQFSWGTKVGSHRFCTIENLDQENELFPFYIWVFCSEYTIENGELKTLSGSSGPAKINYPNELSFYDMSKFSYEVPGDGSHYPEDIKRIFPENLQQKILNFDRNKIIEKNKQFSLSHITIWESIKDAVRNCEIKSASQNHDRTIKIELKNGEEIIGIEPHIDDIITLISSAKTYCGDDIIISTE